LKVEIIYVASNGVKFNLQMAKLDLKFQNFIVKFEDKLKISYLPVPVILPTFFPDDKD